MTVPRGWAWPISNRLGRRRLDHPCPAPLRRLVSGIIRFWKLEAMSGRVFSAPLPHDDLDRGEHRIFAFRACRRPLRPGQGQEREEDL